MRFHIKGDCRVSDPFGAASSLSLLLADGTFARNAAQPETKQSPLSCLGCGSAPRVTERWLRAFPL